MKTNGIPAPPETHLQVLVVHVEDKPGVLNRIASLFRRRGFNIESVTVGPTHQPGVSRMTLVLQGDDQTALLFEANLYKMVNVLRIENVTSRSTVMRDLALIKVHSDNRTRPEILQLGEVFRARVVDVAVEAMILEITGTEEKIDGLIDVLRPFGIIEMVRTGRVAITRGSEAPSADPHFVRATVPPSQAGRSLI